MKRKTYLDYRKATNGFETPVSKTILGQDDSDVQILKEDNLEVLSQGSTYN